MQTLIKFKEFVDEILANNSRNYKLEILKEYKENEDIKYYLNYIYNPYIVTGIAEAKLYKELNFNTVDMVPATVKDLLEIVKHNNTGSDSIISVIQNFKHHMVYCASEMGSEYTANLINLLDKILTKNIQLGIDAKSINKIIPGWIPTFSVMLANKYFEDPERFEGKEFAITRKIDGMRCVAIKNESGNVSFWSRQGQPIEGLVDLRKEMEDNFPNGIVLDGELVAIMNNPDTYKDTMKKARKTTDMEKHGLKMLVFDYMPIKCFREQNCPLPYCQRRLTLEILKNAFEKYFELLPILYQGSDTSMITKLLEELTAKGEEGVMVNLLYSPYEFKRTWALAKCKKFNDVDLEIVDYYEGKDSNVGMLGGFVVRYKDNNFVRVGSGIDEKFAKEAWENICNDPHAYIGKVIVVKYFEETKNEKGGLSLRFPVFKGFRESIDKEGADY